MMFLWAFSKFLLEVHYLGLILPLTFLFQTWLKESHRELATCFVTIGFISETNLWEKMLAWGRKMLNELHHRKLQFWYFLQQVIFYINFKVGISSSNDKSIFVFLIFFFFGVESPNKYGEKVMQFSDLMLLMFIINWENWWPFLIALEVVFMSIHGDA